MRHGTQGHMAEPHEPTHALMWRGRVARATRVHADPRVAPCDKYVFGLAGNGPTSIVGESEYIGALTNTVRELCLIYPFV